MSAAFTPGPWIVGGDWRDIETADGTFITYGFARDNTGVLREADARLIAAAPDLYEALKQAVAYADAHSRIEDCMPADKKVRRLEVYEHDLETDSGVTFVFDVANARAALEKAEGAQ